MNIAFLLGLLLGMIAALMLNIGKGVQKRHVHVFLQGRRLFHRRNRRRLLAWLVGLAMTGGASLPFSLGLMLSGSPSTISAMTGVGLIGLVIYAVRVIGEPIGRQDILGIGLVVAATSALGYLGAGKAATVREFADLRLIQVFAVLIAPAAAACVAALRFRRIHGVAFGVTSGMFIGLALFLADAALVRAGGSFFGQFATLYPYIALLFAVGAVTLTQVGFLRSRALEVVPAVNSALIITPLVLEGAIYGDLPRAATTAFIVVIIVGVVLLSTGATARVSA